MIERHDIDKVDAMTNSAIARELAYIETLIEAQNFWERPMVFTASVSAYHALLLHTRSKRLRKHEGD